MARLPLALLLAALLSSTTANADEGYFSDGNKQLTFMEEGNRSSGEQRVLYALVGATLLSGAVSGFYLLDSSSQSDKVSTSGYEHTGKTWSLELEAIQEDALRSRRIAQISIGVTSGFLLAGIVAYIVTEPEQEAGYQDWQSRSFATPTKDGLVVGQGWIF